MVIPPGVIDGSHGEEGNAGAETGAEGQKRCREEKENDLAAHGTLTERVHSAAPGNKHTEYRAGKRDEGQNGEEYAGDETDVTNLGESTLVEGVEAIHDGGDDHDKAGEDAEVQKLEDPAERPAPAKFGMVCSYEPLEEDEVDDVEDEDARVGEDGRGDGDAGVVRVDGPDDAHDVGDDAGHAETEADGRDDELVALATVELEDGHVEGGAADEEDEEDGGDGHVHGDCWLSAQLGSSRQVGRTLDYDSMS